MRTVNSLSVQFDAENREEATVYTYGGGAFELLLATPPEAPNGYQLLNAFAVGVSNDWPDNLTRPITLNCKGNSCEACNRLVCGPDLHTAEPPASETEPTTFAIRQQDMEFVPAENLLRLGSSPEAPGPVYVGPSGPISQILLNVFAWVGVQPDFVDFHVLRLEDPTQPPTHPLHDKVIAIPVPHRPAPPEQPELVESDDGESTTAKA